MAKLSHKYGGTYTTKGAYLFVAPAPLDTRSVVETIDHLISEDVWKNPDYTAFNGLQVYVESTQELYILKNSSGLKSNLQPQTYFTGTTNQNGKVITPPATSNDIQTKVDLYWQKLASASDLSGLSGVFTFKGVAEAISPDQRIITTRGVVIKEIKGEQQQILTPREPLYCVVTAYEFDMDVYYGWGTSLNDIRFWTDTPTVNSTTPQYGKGEERSVTAYEFDGELYYPIDSTVAPTAGELVTPYESVDGRIIYITEDGDVYDHKEAGGNLMGEATLITYKGCDFSVIQRIALEENTTSETITASSNNSGHVYQIGENEYASNGQIWVKLGSPVEDDWIIL